MSCALCQAGVPRQGESRDTVPNSPPPLLWAKGSRADPTPVGGHTCPWAYVLCPAGVPGP